MKRLTLLFLFLFIPTLFIIGCSETENITDTESEIGQPHIDPTKVDPMKIVAIPDENLVKSIREALELPEDADITAGQLATLKELYCNGSIKDLTGLEYATQLEHLGLRWCLLSINPVTGERESIWDKDKESADLTPLVGLKNLDLDMRSNAIKDLTPLKVLKNLKGLNLYENNIETIAPLAELKQLTRLKINYLDWGPLSENIKDLTPLSRLKQLTELAISGTFDDLTPLSGLKQLTKLYITGLFEDLTPLRELKQLTSLALRLKVTDITVLAELKQLTFLNLKGNNISDVTPLSGLINLERLDIRGNPIEDRTPLEELRKKNPNVVILID